MKEIWKDIKGYETLYQVSNLGNVRSLDTYSWNGHKYFLKYGRLLKFRKTKNNYLRVNLCKDNNKKDYYVHRLVAEAFIQNPDNLPQINHKDENKSNNNVNNLEWCSRSYNCSYGKRLKGFYKMVRCVETGIVYESLKEAGQLNGISYTNICHCCRGRLKTANGLHWKYEL